MTNKFKYSSDESPREFTREPLYEGIPGTQITYENHFTRFGSIVVNGSRGVQGELSCLLTDANFTIFLLIENKGGLANLHYTTQQQ